MRFFLLTIVFVTRVTSRTLPKSTNSTLSTLQPTHPPSTPTTYETFSISLLNAMVSPKPSLQTTAESKGNTTAQTEMEEEFKGIKFPIFIFGMAMLGASLVFWSLFLCLAALGDKHARIFWRNLGSRRRCITGAVWDEGSNGGGYQWSCSLRGFGIAGIVLVYGRKCHANLHCESVKTFRWEVVH